jgi:hypothetical protein
MLDESKVTIEPESAMYSFGEKGALLPEGAIRSFDKVAAYFDKKAYANLKSDASLEKKAIDWAASFLLSVSSVCCRNKSPQVYPVTESSGNGRKHGGQNRSHWTNSRVR